jgi:hypothetical protein
MTAKRIWRKALLGAAVAGLGLLAVLPATARNWRQNPANLAQDYALIVDHRPNGHAVLVMWFAPPILTTGNVQLLDKYIILGMVDATHVAGGTMNFADMEAPVVRDGEGHTLRLVGKDMPADIAAGTAAMQSMFATTFGQLGHGLRLFVFEPGTVHACSAGKVSVAYSGETYTYDTPFPGCPST